MRTDISLAPRNSLVLVMDHSYGEVPESMGERSIAFNESCVAVGTLSEQDGTTETTLSDEADVPPDCNLIFDGTVVTPSMKLSVCAVNDEVLLSIPTSSGESKLRIYSNDGTEPNKIVILVDQETSGD